MFKHVFATNSFYANLSLRKDTRNGHAHMIYFKLHIITFLWVFQKHFLMLNS